jgi:hypothetical protein
MASLTRRLQILVEQRRFERLEHLARQRGTSVAALVRHALDRSFAEEWADTSEAADSFLARPPLDLGEWEDNKRHIDDSLSRGAW